jgi:integrase/recombinase XerD
MPMAVRFAATPFPLLTDFDAAIDAFLLSRHLKNLSRETTDWYRRRLKAFAAFCQQRHETPATFSRETVLAYLRFRLERWTPQTVNGDFRAIKAFARWLVKEGFRADNPTQGIEKLKEPMHYPRTLSDEQVVALVNAIAKHADTFIGLRDLAFVCLLLDTGLRLSEALNLKLSDLDLAQGFVRVMGKGGRERLVPIGESIKTVLHRYLLRRGQVTNAGDWLFITTLATRLTKRQAQIRLSHWAKKAGIEGVRVSPHSLRFTFVRKWLQSGGDSIVLQRILGHQTTQMTAYYARLFATDLKDAHKRHSPMNALAPLLKVPRSRLR